MSKLNYLLSLLTLVSVFGFDSQNINSQVEAETLKQNESGFTVTGDCDATFDSTSNQIKLVSKMTLGSESRARCLIRLEAPNRQKPVRLVPLALKGKVTQAPATVSISSILIGDEPTSLSKEYTRPTSFDLTSQIPKTGYTSTGKSVFGINLILSGGGLEITEMTFEIE